MGRPPKFDSPEQLQALIDGYFSVCEESGDNPTKAGLAAHLDTDKSVLGDYEKKEEFSYSIKEAYRKIERHWANMLPDKSKATAGVIFYLKNAFGYRDKQDIDHTTNGKDLPTPILSTPNVQRNNSDTEDTGAE